MTDREATPNAEAEYVDADTGRRIARERYYDPGLDLDSDHTKEMMKGGWHMPWYGFHFAYFFGTSLNV